MTQVSIMAVRALVETVGMSGVATPSFLAEAGLDEALLGDGNLSLSLAQYQRVVRAALAASGNEALGLHLGEHASAGKFGVVGYLAEQSGCLREALQISSSYVRVLTEGPRLEIVEQGEVATLRFTLILDGLPEARLPTEFAAAWLLRLIRQFVGDDQHVRCAYFAYAEPAYRGEYARVFGGRAQFAHAFSGLEIEREWLDRPRPNSSPELLRALQTQADLQLARRDHNAAPVARVKRWLSSHSLQTRPTMDAVARDLGMSARSLRRLLASEQVVYTDLLEQARAERAKELLADPRCSVQDAAYALGFEEPAAFSRAFRRWTGMPPSAYRASLEH